MTWSGRRIRAGDRRAGAGRPGTASRRSRGEKAVYPLRHPTSCGRQASVDTAGGTSRDRRSGGTRRPPDVDCSCRPFRFAVPVARGRVRRAKVDWCSLSPNPWASRFAGKRRGEAWARCGQGGLLAAILVAGIDPARAEVACRLVKVPSVPVQQQPSEPAAVKMTPASRRSVYLLTRRPRDGAGGGSSAGGGTASAGGGTRRVDQDEQGVAHVNTGSSRRAGSASRVGEDRPGDSRMVKPATERGPPAPRLQITPPALRACPQLACWWLTREPGLAARAR